MGFFSETLCVEAAGSILFWYIANCLVGWYLILINLGPSLFIFSWSWLASHSQTDRDQSQSHTQLCTRW